MSTVQDNCDPSLAAASLLKEARALAQQQQFDRARALLDGAARLQGLPETMRVKMAAAAALYTAKDKHRPINERYDEALDLIPDIATTRDQETLGVAGGIYKRKWFLTGRKQDLEAAAALYLRGAREGIARDLGYTAINAAFVLDVLSQIESSSYQRGLIPDPSHLRRKESRKLRQQVVETLTQRINEPGGEQLRKQWWTVATLVEAYFGLGDFDAAGRWLGLADQLDATEWQRESTLSQLASLALLRASDQTEQAISATPEWRFLADYLPDQVEALRSTLRGKTGLALSGGGFRASLFHIGVLARLAELDALRSIEVLSCVSGGSILGAQLYLEIRHLLQTKSDHEITRQDYIDIVHRLHEDFLAGVQRNVRTRALASLWINLKVLVKPAYTLADHIGELIESEIYSRVRDGCDNGPRWLNELTIKPAGEKEFHPDDQNWRRRAKVPTLILNSTSINTGHNWQFTPTSMGEASTHFVRMVESNARLQPMLYADAPQRHRRVRLGKAVAASACVPGIFPPVLLMGLYPDTAVTLVDGGVHDNQGTASLIEQDCTGLLVSDAGSQLADVPIPRTDPLGLLGRVTHILLNRVRIAQFREIISRQRASAQRRLMFVHLKRGIESPSIAHKGSKEAPPQQASIPAGESDSGLPASVQRLLPLLRTDLDSFADIEAYTLMYCGYQMTARYYSPSPGESDTRQEDWPFLRVAEVFDDPKRLRRLEQFLKVGSRRGLRAVALSLPLRIALIVTMIVLGAMLVAAVWSGRYMPTSQTLTLGLQIALVCFLVFLILTFTATRVMRRFLIRTSVVQIVLDVVVCLFGWIPATLHLLTLERVYLAKGSLKAFGIDPGKSQQKHVTPRDA
ncbi:MAG: patatin-like phospholipase family protein [Phycisphaeraceae bacterium]|nr:patatin-like phospholipase family protein [Phycisphaeraceae bacterium]